MTTEWHSSSPQVNDVFTETNATRVWADGDAKSASGACVSAQRKHVRGPHAYLAAMRRTLRTSLTPARRQESIWQTSMAPACKSCLKTMRLWACSPVATPMPCGFNALRITAWPRMSSGAVGSSINLRGRGVYCHPAQNRASLFTKA